MRAALRILFWFIPGLLALSFIFTIVGSAVNHDNLLTAGIIGWLVTPCLFFAWLVALIASRTRKYRG